MLQPEIEPVEENLIPLTDHVALRARSESLRRVYSHQIGKLLGPEKSLNIISNPDVGRSIFDFQGNLLILIMTQDRCLLQERAEVPIIETAWLRMTFTPGLSIEAKSGYLPSSLLRTSGHVPKVRYELV